MRIHNGIKPFQWYFFLFATTFSNKFFHIILLILNFICYFKVLGQIVIKSLPNSLHCRNIKESIKVKSLINAHFKIVNMPSLKYKKYFNFIFL